MLNLNFPAGYNRDNTLIFGIGEHRAGAPLHTPVYVTINNSTTSVTNLNIEVMISDDSSFNSGYANIFFMCMAL